MSLESWSDWEMSPRTTEMIGHQQELVRFRRYLETPNERRCLYYWARGGLGKTRLLEEMHRIVIRAGGDFSSTGIIDLYHTDTHTTIDVEWAIVTGLDPAQGHFAEYRARRAEYLALLDSGAEAGVLDEHREELSKQFVRDCCKMAEVRHKLVIFFDTLELLQYESSIVEEKAGLDMVDTRLRTWLLAMLPRLCNVLIVLAGRPKERMLEEAQDPQVRLENDMREAFGKGYLDVLEVEPLNLEETSEFIAKLGAAEMVPSKYLAIVHRLTCGKPIFLHLLVDVLGKLSLEPRSLWDELKNYLPLLAASDEDPELDKARRHFEEVLVRAIFERSKWSDYLARLALMPKGFDTDLLKQVLGMEDQAAEELIKNVEHLSFIKRFKAPTQANRLHVDRLFLHDEMYRLMRLPSVAPHLRVNESDVADALVEKYYTPLIEGLEEDIAYEPNQDKRTAERDRLHKLQVERLYYQLVRRPLDGYGVYRRLSDEANRQRWPSFGMLVNDEFLRFYNAPGRRQQFDKVGLDRKHIIRDSAEMWVERFHWLARYHKEVAFASDILDNPGQFYIDPTEDVAVLGNVCALWSRAWAMLRGFDDATQKRTQDMLRRLPDLEACDEPQKLARARLGTSIGYQYRWKGALREAVDAYLDSIRAFNALDKYHDELAIVLNNLAFAYARQGRIALARIRGKEALDINKEKGNEYSTGLTHSILAYIERVAGEYDQAIHYGECAKEVFQKLNDAHGMVRASYSIAYARRRKVRAMLDQERQGPEALEELASIGQLVQSTISLADAHGLTSEIPSLKVERAKVSREQGRYAARESLADGKQYFRQAERFFQEVLAGSTLSDVERAEIQQDLAECLAAEGNYDDAEAKLNDAVATIGEEYAIKPGERLPEPELPTEPFWSLGTIERLRARIAYDQAQFEDGIKHSSMAYAYFRRNWPDSPEKMVTLELAYHRLKVLPRAARIDLFNRIKPWTDLLASERADARDFVRELRELLAV